MLSPDQCGSALGDSGLAFLLCGETTKYILKDTHREKGEGISFHLCVCVCFLPDLNDKEKCA